MLLGNLQKLATDTINPDSDSAWRGVLAWFDMNIGCAQAIRFSDDAVYQLDNRRCSGKTFVFFIITIFNINVTITHSGEDIVEAFLKIFTASTAQKLDDVFRQPNPKHIVAGIDDTLDFHDPLVIGWIINKDNCFFLIASNR